jgi:CheY-like chemotaxis protein
LDYNNINNKLRASRSAYHFRVIAGGKISGAGENDNSGSNIGTGNYAVSNVGTGNYAEAEAGKGREELNLRVLKGGRPANVPYPKESSGYVKQARPHIAQVDRYVSKNAGEAQYRIDPANVVIVDENPADLLKVGEVLKSNGCVVRKFEKPFEALAALKEEPCAVLIAAEKLRQMSGVVLAELAKKSGNASGVLLLTESAHSGALDLLRRELIDGFICKPVSSYELMYKVSALIDASGEPLT